MQTKSTYKYTIIVKKYTITRLLKADAKATESTKEVMSVAASNIPNR